MFEGYASGYGGEPRPFRLLHLFPSLSSVAPLRTAEASSGWITARLCVSGAYDPDSSQYRFPTGPKTSRNA